jgi:hypothetical protein
MLELVECKFARNGLTNWKTFLANIFENIIWHLFAGESHQVVKITVPYCLHLKWILLSTQRCPNIISNLFWWNIFSICHRCQRHRLQMTPLVHLELRTSPRIFKKIGKWNTVTQGKLFNEKNLKSKISWLLSV